MLMRKTILSAFLCTLSCGQQDKVGDKAPSATSDSSLQALKQGFLALQGQLQALVQSDFATCSGANVQASSLVKTICQVAQAATAEARVELKDSLNTLANSLNAKLNSTQVDVNTLSSSWQQIYGAPFPATTGAQTPTVADCQANNSKASLVQCMVVTAGQISTINTQITSINSQLATLGSTIAGVPTEVLIGSENASLGPVYESVIRVGSGTQINAFADGNGAAITVSSNPLNGTDGSTTVTITATNTLANGNYVKLQGCSAGRGLTNEQLYGTFTVSSVTSSAFNITVAQALQSSWWGTAFGGSGCIIQPYTGSGMATIWTAPTSADAAVRTTSQGSSAHNWVVMKPASGTFSGQGLVCYDKVVPLQTFANIATAGMQTAINAASTLPVASGNLICK